MQFVQLIKRYWQQSFDLKSYTSFKQFVGMVMWVLIGLGIGGTNISLLFHPRIDMPHLNLIGVILLVPLPALELRRLTPLLQLGSWLVKLLLALDMVVLFSLGASNLCDMLVAPGYLVDMINESNFFSWLIPLFMLAGIIEGIMFSFCFANEES